MRHTCKNAAHLENCSTLAKMRHTWKNATHLEKCAAPEKIHTRKNAPHLEKCATLEKIRRTRKNAPHLEKCFKLGEMRLTRKNAAHSEKCATLGEMRHTWKNAPHMKKIRNIWNGCSRRHFLAGHLPFVLQKNKTTKIILAIKWKLESNGQDQSSTLPNSLTIYGATWGRG